MKPIQILTLHPSGFPVIFAIEDNDPKLKHLIDQLTNYGFRPGIAGDTWPRTPEGTPICPKHGVPMTKREKQGDIWWSHPVINPDTGEKLYCRGYETKNGRGYDLPTEMTINAQEPPARRTTAVPTPPHGEAVASPLAKRPTAVSHTSQQPQRQTAVSVPPPNNDINNDPELVKLNEMFFGK